MRKRRLLWIGDAVVSSGFAKATHHVLDVLREVWDVHVLGLNYLGDPHKYPYPIYPCWAGGDGFGLGRVAPLVTSLRPDVVVVQNDPWNVPEYMKLAGNVPVVASMPVDGKNCRGYVLNGLALAVFWTEFGRREACVGGYAGPTAVIPLGVDLGIYQPGDRLAARRALGLSQHVHDAFVVGNINRNQPRKRLDLTISYFAEWVRSYDVRDAFLYLHVAPTGDQGYDVSQLMRWYGLSNRLILAEPAIGYGVREETLVRTYQVFDLQVTTSQGEGWGLPTMEGMACGIPQLAPDWAALGEWARGAAELVPCSEICVTPNHINAVGGVADRRAFVEALDRLYHEPAEREALSRRGLELVHREEYRWENVGDAFAAALDSVLAEQRVTA